MRGLPKLLRRTRASAPPAVPDPQPAIAAGIPVAQAPAESPPVPRAAVPLRSLTQYQYDPAFAQFQQKLRRPRGTTRSPTRLRPEEYPPRQTKPGA
jgi:hypothetical protein